MAKGTRIILSGEPKGVFSECVISGTPKPGTLMMTLAATALVNGRPTMKARDLTAGAKGPIVILLEDNLQGFVAVGSANSDTTSGGVTVTGGPAPGTAYVAGTRARIYWPAMGEEFNLILEDVAGTADTVAIGDKFGISNTGKLKADSTYTSAPFEALEALDALTGDTMLHVRYLGSHA